MKPTYETHRRAALGLPIYGPYSRNRRRRSGWHLTAGLGALLAIGLLANLIIRFQ